MLWILVTLCLSSTNISNNFKKVIQRVFLRVVVNNPRIVRQPKFLRVNRELREINFMPSLSC